jgi:hypothetical protein
VQSRALCLILAACGGHNAGAPDAVGADTPSQSDATVARDGSIDGPVDAATGPSGVDCFYNAQQLGTCPAPVIAAAFLTQDCDATTGIFVVGTGFQSANQFDVNNGWLPHGPYALTPKLNRDSWNVLTPTFVCITTSADPQYWTGFQMQLRNPDGQLSNAVTVTNQLSGRPPLPTTDSLDPFDPDACLEAGMTQQEALAHFAPAASTASIGSVEIVSHERACNSATGCGAWNATTAVAPAAIGLAIAGTGSQVDLTLGSTDCNRLGASDYTLTYNTCGAYALHVAAHCLQLSSTARSAIANDGSYTQTDFGAVLHF